MVEEVINHPVRSGGYLMQEEKNRLETLRARISDLMVRL